MLLSETPPPAVTDSAEPDPPFRDGEVELGAELTQVPPLEVSTFPLVPGATRLTAEVPFPTTTDPEVNEVAPVPPFATPRAPETAAD